MTTYTIKPEYIDELCIDLESATHIYTIDEVKADAENFGMELDEYISKYMDEHND